MQFDARGFITDKFGTPPQLRAALYAQGFDAPTLFTISKWMQRGSIPGNWLAAMISVLEGGGKRPTIAKYLNKADNDDIFQ